MSDRLGKFEVRFTAARDRFFPGQSRRELRKEGNALLHDPEGAISQEDRSRLLARLRVLGACPPATLDQITADILRTPEGASPKDRHLMERLSNRLQAGEAVVERSVSDRLARFLDAEAP